ncbi:sulfatase family protein [Thalassoglobus polymorphus]|uniref:Choline-sulfatase n=1 Tax=Thalassoglobus polymorphus TaxID=2527994 RepID=A0A517QM50_9PLAN|nr:sulfatase [Thalassoglobus polymorphus]QDT32718.1 Choline-sulfatase [Thalassoglobus polymorphus]
MRLLLILCSLLFLVCSNRSQAQEKPNVLIIMADDCTYNDLPLYGGENALTPNIDRLAAQSLTFNRAYLSEAMCQPCRAELYSGQYPMRNGCAWNHSASRSETKSLPQYLTPLGYRVGIAGKVHVKPSQAFPFENVAGFDKNCVRNPTLDHDLGEVAKFMTRDSAEPFCLVVALVEPHVPWVMGDASQYPPKKIKLPPNIADTPRTRKDFGRYLAEVTYMDGQVGDLLSALERTGKADNTLVLFTSEQGAQFPGCKWTNWDTGLHTALVARWPGMVPAGKRTDAIVQYADIAPTLVELAGGKPAEAEFDGTSFVKVLKGTADEHRQFAYGVHNNIPEGPAYPIRTITDGTFRYIQNLTPGEMYIEKHLMGINGKGALNNPYWQSWVWDSSTSPRTYGLVKRYMMRPSEELYETAADPYEMNNLANSPEYANQKKRLFNELTRWLEQQGDPGIPQDTFEAIEAARRGEHLYGPSTNSTKK